MGKGGGARYAEDAAEVLRGIERGASHQAPGLGSGPVDYLTLPAAREPPPPVEGREPTPSSIIIP